MWKLKFQQVLYSVNYPVILPGLGKVQDTSLFVLLSDFPMVSKSKLLTFAGLACFSSSFFTDADIIDIFHDDFLHRGTSFIKAETDFASESIKFSRIASAEKLCHLLLTS